MEDVFVNAGIGGLEYYLGQCGLKGITLKDLGIKNYKFEENDSADSSET